MNRGIALEARSGPAASVLPLAAAGTVPAAKGAGGKVRSRIWSSEVEEARSGPLDPVEPHQLCPCRSGGVEKSAACCQEDPSHALNYATAMIGRWDAARQHCFWPSTLSL
ncbi:hypothetical protein BDA96_04G030500 [Sorghum bicolor]|nr:hypothetical protein BDA96_04G030500 [Sorghum bicolor]